jgi:hypothetical protein
VAQPAEQQQKQAPVQVRIVPKSKPTAGYSGRGGAGNWSAAAAAAAAQREREEIERKEKLVDAKVLEDVDLGLAMPQPAYQLQDRTPK